MILEKYKHKIGPLHHPVTWYLLRRKLHFWHSKKRYSYQSSPTFLDLKVQLCNLRPSTIYSVLCDCMDRAKGLLINWKRQYLVVYIDQSRQWAVDISWCWPHVKCTLNRPFTESGHMVRNKLYWDANSAVGLPNQRNSYQSSPTFLCFESPTALFASQHNLFRTMWPDPAKGLLNCTGMQALNLPAGFYFINMVTLLCRRFCFFGCCSSWHLEQRL